MTREEIIEGLKEFQKSGYSEYIIIDSKQRSVSLRSNGFTKVGKSEIFFRHLYFLSRENPAEKIHLDITLKISDIIYVDSVYLEEKECLK